jgi:hypothetical protein
MPIDLTLPGALTHESVRDLIASASDSTHTQLRVTAAGIAFISSVHFGAECIDGLAFRLETWNQGADYVGPNAAKDHDFVNRIYNVLKNNWPNPSSTYIDLF